MGILPHIRSDAEFLRNLIASLRSDRTTVTSNGKLLTGEELEASLEAARAENRTKLRKLDLILESGFIPEKYVSIIDKQTYYPSSEELRQKEEALPPGKHSFFCTKKSRKSTGLQNSNYAVVQDDGKPIISFFIEHKDDKKYPKGGFAAKVKKGSLHIGDTESKYAVKIYHKNMFHGDTFHELRLAMRAAYCYKQLGREGYSFRRNGKQYMVTEWLTGVNLDVANQDSLQSMPIPRRIVMAINLFRELSILHKQGLIHNDIKPSNVMVNYGKLNFVDLDSVRPQDEEPILGSTPMYTEHYLPNAQMSYDAVYNPRNLYLQFNQETDIYAMGLTLTKLFEEIYTQKYNNQVIKVNGGSVATHTFKTINLYRGSKYSEHPELQKLLKNMVFHEQTEISTADDYIEALLKTLATYPDYEQYLAEDKLKGTGSDLSYGDGERAFRDIEIELLGYNQRVEAYNKLSM